MKTRMLIAALLLPLFFALGSCTKSDTSPDYFTADISNYGWSANNVYSSADTTGYSAIEADNDDGSLFYVNLPTYLSPGNYSVADDGDCSIEYIDPQGDSYSIQGGTLCILSSSFSGTQGSFEGTAVNDLNTQDQINISGGTFYVH